jgi:transposase
MTRPIGTAEELHRRRVQAVERLRAGESPSVIARVLGVDPGSVHRWRRLAEAGKLAPAPPPAREPALSDARLRRLEAMLRQGAKHHGWQTDLWTAARVAVLIERRFKVKHHPEHARKILKKRMGWTSQKPRRKALERDGREAERWRADELPRIVREAFARKAHLAFLDESGFGLTPSVRRTFSPRGETPVLQAWDRRDRISAISCVTLSPVMARPDLHFHLLPTNRTVKAKQVVGFLRDLKKQLGGPFTVVWDGHGIHSKARLVKAWLAKHPEVVAETLPGYCPEMNPDEWVWSWTKHGRLANLAAWDDEDLRDHLEEALVTLKFEKGILSSFFQDADLALAV